MNTKPRNRIQRLPTELANQIAAGEVVERPASVVKELLENSLDSGATRLQVEVEQGGIKLIRVRDNGCGIHRDDLPLALSSHATSKITTIDDLERIASLGFRGEALPSIASVSRLTIASHRKGEGQAWRIAASGSESTTEPEPVAHPQGTTVEVKDLFYCVPARRKFLRTEKTEFEHLRETVRRIALCRHDITISLQHNRRNIFSLRSATDEAGEGSRVAAICGAAFMEQALPLEANSTGLHLRGWIGTPEFSRSQSDIQYFYLNGRTVRDRLITHALRQAFADTLPAGRHPAYLLYLKMDPSLVDVNVHPTKHEVRFREARRVHDFLAYAIGRALHDLSPPIPYGEKSSVEEAVPFATSSQIGSIGCPSPAPSRTSGHASSGHIREAVEHYDALVGKQQRSVSAPEPSTSGPLGKPLCQLHNRFILAETEGGVALIDIPTAQTELAHARLLSSLDNAGGVSQPLLIPVPVTLPEATSALAETESELLESLGFELVRTGPQSIAVHRIPALLGNADPAALVEELLEAIGSQQYEGETAPLLELMARHAGRENSTLSQQQMDRLLRELGSEGHGRKKSRAWVHLTLEELGALFKG